MSTKFFDNLSSATYCAASIATLCQLEQLPMLFENTAEWVAK